MVEMNKKYVFLIMPESDVSWTNYCSTPPLSLISLGSYLQERSKKETACKENELSIFICDFNIEAGKKYFYENFNKLEAKNNIELFFGISINCFNIENSFKLAKKIKIKHPNAYIIIGGPYVTSYIFGYKRYYRIPDYVDYVIPYYGEKALFDLIFNNSQITFDNECAKCIQGSEQPIENTMLDYSLVGYLEDYQNGNENVNYFGGKPYYQLSYLSAYGCPYRSEKSKKGAQWCGFCSLIDKNLLQRKVDYVVKEVEQALSTLIEKSNKNGKCLNYLLLRDVSDFPNATVAKELKSLIKNKKEFGNIQEIKILGYQRANLINKNNKNIDPFDIIFIGAESADDSILDNCNKGFSVNDLKNAINILKDKKKKIILSFILGLKGENYRTVEATKQFIANNLNEEDFISAGVNIYLPFPGSPFFDLLIKRIGIKHTDVFGIDDLKRLQKEWVTEFTNMSLYELVREKAEIENIIRNKLKNNKYFDFGVNKRIEVSEGEVPSAFKDFVNSFCSHIIAIAEANDIKGHWWGTASIKESLLKKIYQIKEDFINLNFFIGDNNHLFDIERRKFSKLNGDCFSYKYSILKKEVLDKSLPTISDILPRLNKSLMMIKNPPEDWEEVKGLFDYVEILHDDSSYGIEFSEIKDKIIQLSQNSNYSEIKDIIRDYNNLCEKNEWREKQIQDAFKLIFFMYEMHLTLLNYDIFIYYPIKTTSKGSVAFTLGLRYNNFKNKGHFKNFILNYIKLLNNTILQRLFDDIYQENIKNSSNSAIAAIMTRNMSHNIDSHVTPRSTVEAINNRLNELFNNNYDESTILKIIQLLKDKLDEYRQKRADFLAEITSEPLLTTKPCLFYRQLILPFIENTLIMDNIARNEGICYKNKIENRLKIKVFKNGNEEFKAKYTCSNNPRAQSFKYPEQGIPYTKMCFGCQIHKNPDNLFYIPEIADDFDIELPGPVGEHAFYGFLENLIRNAAKHNRKIFDEQCDKNLEINININDGNEEDYYSIEIWDNVTNPDDIKNEISLFEKIKDYLAKHVVDDTGKKINEAFGITEMKVDAALLAGEKDFMNINNHLKVEKKDETKNGIKYELLQYKFKLMKSKKVCAFLPNWKDKSNIDELKKRGIWIFTDMNNFRDCVKPGDYKQKEANRSIASFKFAVFDCTCDGNNVKELIKELMPYLPYRIIVMKKGPENDFEEDEELKKRAVIVNDNNFPDKYDEIMIWVWTRWLSRWNDNNEQNTTFLEMNLDQNQNELPTEKWIECAENFNNQDCRFKIKIWARENGEISLSPEGVNNCGGCHILFDRHGGAFEKVFNGQTNFYDGKDAYIFFDKLNKDFSIIFNPIFPTGNESWFFPYGLIESGLLKIIIIDERLAEASLNVIDDIEARNMGYVLTGTSASPTLWHIAFSAKIYICTHFCNEPLHKSSYEKAEKNAGFKQLPILNFGFNGANGNKSEIRYKKNREDRCKDLDNIDMAIIHQGIFDEWLSGYNRERFLEELKKIVPFIIVDSGRGLPHLPKGVKFIPFSILNDLICGKRIAKYTLSQILLGLTRRSLNEEE